MKAAIPFLFALSVVAQPLPPASYGPDLPAAPITYPRTLVWNPSATVGVTYDVALNGATLANVSGTNYTLPLLAGTNRIEVRSVQSTNRSAAATLTYALTPHTEVSVWLESGPAPSGPFTRTNNFTLRDPQANLFARAGIARTNVIEEGPLP